MAAAEIVVDGTTVSTDGTGEARIQIDAGSAGVTASKPGYAPVTTTVAAQAGQEVRVSIALEPLPSVSESVTVSATRTERGLDDQPMRVEVLDYDEIDEKLLMKPADIVMMLNEMGGMRVQATSPSLGAASVRIQGMRGRYTRFLSDGLPLFGERVSLGLMQIPPMDLGRIEVIKGAVSSLYGAGAIGGVVNLVSRRPSSTPERQLLVNRTSRGATDVSAWYATPLAPRWGLTLLGSANGQSRNDLDGDGWADIPRYERAVLRPRLFWDDQAGKSAFVTFGVTWEDRVGGTLSGAVLPATGRPHEEALTTRRTDIGGSFQTLSSAGLVWATRGSWMVQHQDHRFGDVTERDVRRSGFAELTARRAAGRHTIVAGAAVQYDRFRPTDLPRFAYSFIVPGAFVQDDVDISTWLVVSASARIDRHSRYGTFASPNLSGIVRRGRWSSRISYGAGFSAPTPVTEETDAAGLSRLEIPVTLRAERGRSASVDLTHTIGSLSATATGFYSRVADPVEVDRIDRFVLANQREPTTNTGIELLAIWRGEGISLVGNYTFVRSRHQEEGRRVDVPLTPRHSVGFDAAWESSRGTRVGVEWFYTGTQRLEANPYRERSEPYRVFGLLAAQRIGRLQLFVNGENLTNVRQTAWEPLLRPTRSVDGRWTVDAWAPLDGRNVNAGVRVTF